MTDDLNTLISETRNPATMGLDMLPTLDMLMLINDEDQKVPQAIREVLPAIAQAVEQIVCAIKMGGRLIYLGAGTSGRLGILDATECPPTFGVPRDMVMGLIAGGPAAVLQSIENAEDSVTGGIDDLNSVGLTVTDVVVGLAASGRTPYVVSALRFARKQGCKTVAISCNPDSLIAAEAEIAISPIPGPEVLTGSSRMKAGSAQKMILNMISTATMVKLGKVYQNLMIDVKATNEKLRKRACHIVAEIADVSCEEAERALMQTEFSVKPAILMIINKISASQALQDLAKHHGQLRAALHNENNQAIS
jgi:N-acetylmuramic acid 6-phosphate etherase